MLQTFVPDPRLVEIDTVDVAVPAARAYEAARRFDFGSSRVIRALFELRTLPDRLARHHVEPFRLRIDDITTRSPFRMLDERPGEAFVVGAVGRFWEPNIPFADITPATFAAFAEPGFGKVAWGIRAEPRGPDASRLILELRVSATDDDAWKRLHLYFMLIGPFSRFIRRHALHLLAAELGSAVGAEERSTLPGDDLLRDAEAQMTMGIDITAPPGAIWPWLVQMGCRRAGWYSYDRLDNAGVPSARELHPEWQRIAVGDMLPARPEGDDGFEVLRVEQPHTLVLGGVYDRDAGQVRFHASRPTHFWAVTWAFVLKPLDANTTRLIVRARVAFAPGTVGLRLIWMRPIHWFMEREQLHNIKERAEALARGEAGQGTSAPTSSG